jgi:hypothetical protein
MGTKARVNCSEGIHRFLSRNDREPCSPARMMLCLQSVLEVHKHERHESDCYPVPICYFDRELRSAQPKRAQSMEPGCDG